MFINFWYVAEQSRNLTEKPLKVQLLGAQFVLWRDSKGKVNCVSNTCTHRGGALGDGRIRGDCIECPYHGWQFSGDGSCTRLPSIGPDAKIPARTRIDAYPVVEKYGLIHVFLGDLPEAERPRLLVFDLNNLNAKPMTLIPKFKSKLKKATSIIGFLNHLQGDLKMKALEAGCDTVMPRSAFSQTLPNLLRRYGLDEEEEYSQQPM